MAIKSLNLADELWERLDTAALGEGRSRSNMAARLLEDALAGRGGGTVTPKAAAAGDSAQPDPPRPVSAPSEPRPAAVGGTEGLSRGVVSAATVEDSRLAAAVQVGGAKPAVVSAASRKAMCEHRIGPDAYCPRCDG